MQEASFSSQTFQAAQGYTPAPKKKDKRMVIIIVLGILLLAGGYFGVTRFLGSKNKAQPTPVSAPTPTESIAPTDTPTPEESPTPEVSKTPTPKPTGNPVDSATGLNRSKLSVEIQNGSGEVGVASKMSDFLKSLGYHVASTGNADNFTYENVSVLVKSASSGYLSLLKKDLAKQYTVGSSSATLSASSSADALVIVGK